MTDVECAYLAGILDGEGCISFGRRKKYLTPTIQVSNTNFALIDWLQSRFVKSTWYNMNERRPTRKPCYMWRCAGKQAAEVVRLALPYLLLKRQQAELVLKLRRFKIQKFGISVMTAKDFAENDELLGEMRVLNQRGIVA